jgi:hypothetical protein
MIEIDQLLSAYTSDPDGDPISLVSAGPSPQGAAISVGNTQILYTPVNDSDDEFPYTIRDAQGATATGRIAIRVVKPGGLANRVSAAGSGVVIEFAGLPGKTYDILRAPRLSGPWTSVGQHTAPAGLLFNFQDISPFSPAFYRLDQR